VVALSHKLDRKDLKQVLADTRSHPPSHSQPSSRSASRQRGSGSGSSSSSDSPISHSSNGSTSDNEDNNNGYEHARAERRTRGKQSRSGTEFEAKLAEWRDEEKLGNGEFEPARSSSHANSHSQSRRGGNSRSLSPAHARTHRHGGSSSNNNNNTGGGDLLAELQSNMQDLTADIQVLKQSMVTNNDLQTVIELKKQLNDLRNHVLHAASKGGNAVAAGVTVGSSAANQGIAADWRLALGTLISK
jgi:hypothetical protein